MQDTNNLSVQKEIQSNMTVVSRQGPSYNNEEIESLQNNKQAWGNSRASRKMTTNNSNNNNNLNKIEQHKNPRDLVSLPNCENILNIRHNADVTRTTQTWLETVDRRVKSADTQNNRESTENLETMRENFRNSQESIQRTNSVNIMDLAQSMRAPRNTLQNTGNEVTYSRSNSRSNNMSSASLASITRSTDELDSSVKVSQAKDPHTAAIDLSNNCRQFYFNHMKTAESIKQSIRASRHTRAREKMEGKQPTTLDNAMHRLRAEMADLMDQDLSLMSQLLKLNDKIEDIKSQASQRYRPNSFDSGSCYLSNTDMSDSEMSDNEDSRFDLTKSVNSPYGYISAARRQSDESETQLRRVDSSEKDIIVYRKRSTRTKKAKKPKSSSDTEEDTAKEDNDEDDDEEEVFSSDEESKAEEYGDKEEEVGEDESHSDTGSTISNKSNTSENTDGANKTPKKNSDSECQSPTNKAPEVPPKPVKGGVSRNTSFLDFHKNNGNVRTSTGINLTFQGHNVNVEKYFVPQSLVYLKHTKSENVFCQFSH